MSEAAEHAPRADEHDAMVLYANKAKTFAWVLLGCVAIALSVYIGLAPPPGKPPWLVLGMSVLTLGASTTATAWYLWWLVSSAPMVIIDHEGILVNSDFFGCGVITWSEIRTLMARKVPF